MMKNRTRSKQMMFRVTEDEKDLKHLMSEVSRIGNNINQITKRVNTINKIYECDLEEIKQGQQEIVRLLRQQVRNTNKIKNL